MVCFWAQITAQDFESTGRATLSFLPGTSSSVEKKPRSVKKTTPARPTPTVQQDAIPPDNQPPAISQKPPRQRKPRTVGKKGSGRTRRPKAAPVPARRRIAAVGVEMVCLLLAAMTGIAVLLGYATEQFAGTGLLAHLLPFTLGVLGLIVVAALLLIGWMRLRPWLQRQWLFLPAALALTVVLVLGGFAAKGYFFFAFSQFRILVGGKEEASRVTLAHQVFAAYRRHDPDQLRQLIDRARVYSADIETAAQTFGLDPDLLHGLAATESSFLPRESKDGGQGLFQLTQIPEAALREAGNRLGVDRPVISDHRHNGFVAAATLRHYLNQMNNDLFLGLLAYNIGPKNGGLRFIMQQYGATDFITIQPYLQQLPRDYPIRVLSQALAFRLFRTSGTLPAYEEGLNAVRIQHVGIPGWE
jgi:hypothetical protein